MLDEFLTWWARRMLEFVPGRLLRRDEGWADALLVRARPGAASGPSGPVVDCVLRRNRRDTALGRFVLDEMGVAELRRTLGAHKRPATVVLRPPPAALLERQVALPLAAEREPDRVLHYEMDRVTPFGSDEVFWTWAVERRDLAQRRVHLRLSLVPKAGLLPTIEALARAGAAPAVLEAAAAAGPARRIGLRPADSRSRRWRRRALAASAAGCAALAVAAAVLPFVLQSVERGAVDRQVASLRAPVAQVEALRHRLAAAAAGTDVIAAERARVGDPLQVLAAITEILPDDTFLTDLTLRGGKLEMTGQSAAAARLIASLSGDALIRNPAFTAPVTRTDNGRADIFAIRAELGS